MASSNDLSKDAHGEAPELNLAQIMADLRKGEKTADTIESNLTSLEKKIDDLLASFEESERAKVEEANGKSSSQNDENDKKP